MIPVPPVRVLLVALAAVTLAGCASTGDASGGNGVQPSPIPAPAVLTPIPGTHERVARWRLASASPGSRTLLLDVEIGGPPCDVVTGLDVTEDTDEVRVTVHAGRQAGARCGPGVPAILGTVRVAAHLRSALGSRRVTGG